MTLDLYNPTSTDAVMNVSFLTASTVITPSAYQGLVVPAGHLVAENVGDFVQNQSEIATLVSAQSTAVVADELQQWSSGSTGGLALRLGSPSLSTVWHFAQTNNSNKTTVIFHVANPGTQAGVATFDIGVPVGFDRPHPSTGAGPVGGGADHSGSSPRPQSDAVHGERSGRRWAWSSPGPSRRPNGSSPPLWGSIAGRRPPALTGWSRDRGPEPLRARPMPPQQPGRRQFPGRPPPRSGSTTLGTGRTVGSFTVAPGSLAVLGPT